MSTNFDGVGQSQFGGPAGPGVLPMTTGKYIYVHNSGSATSVGLDHKVPVVQTIDAAVGKARSDKGDIIVVLPGHSETLSSSSALSLDVTGLTIIGLGSGATRPTLTLDTGASTTIAVGADNVTVKNLILVPAFADITAAFTLTTAQNFRLESCYISAPTADENFLNVVDTSATTDDNNGLTVVGCKWIEPDTATLSLVKLDGDMTDVTIKDNYVQLGVNNNEAALLTIADGKSVFSLQMTDNIVYRLNTDTATGAILLHTNQSDNTGVVARNFAQHADTASELLITASSGLGVFNNYASGVAGASGYILPAVDS